MNFPARYWLLCFALVMAGCKKKPMPPTASATAPAATHPATTACVLTVDGDPVTFPPAEVRVHPGGSGIAVDLSSAETSGAGRNSIRLDMAFPDLADASELNGAEWHFISPEEPQEDTLNAIELKDRTLLLDPQDVRALLRWDGEHHAVIQLTGTFRLFDPPDAAKPLRTVWVEGRISAIEK